MQHNPATHGVQVPGSTVKSCLTVQHSKRKSQRFMHSGYRFLRAFLSRDLRSDEKGGACRPAEGPISLCASFVCRPLDLSYLRNLNAPDHLLASAGEPVVYHRLKGLFLDLTKIDAAYWRRSWRIIGCRKVRRWRWRGISSAACAPRLQPRGAEVSEGFGIAFASR